MDDSDIEEWDDWHKNLNSWENHQDELELITSKLSQEESLYKCILIYIKAIF